MGQLFDLCITSTIYTGDHSLEVNLIIILLMITKFSNVLDGFLQYFIVINR